MCEVLVQNVDNSNPNLTPDQAAAGLYKRDDVVSVHPDGHVFGSGEGLPGFVQIRVADATPEEFAPYCCPEYGRGRLLQEQIPEGETDIPGYLGIDTDDVFDWEATGPSVGGMVPTDVYLRAIVTKRQYQWDRSELPPTAQSALNNPGQAAVSRVQAFVALRNKQSGQIVGRRRWAA